MGRGRLFLIQSPGMAAALAAVWLFTAKLWTSHDPYIGSGTDLITFEHPFQAFATERLRHGDLPFWNPYELGGVPFEAGVHGHLSPSYWSLFVIPLPADLGFGLVLHLALAAAGMAYWASRRGLSREAQALAGVTFALSAFLLLHCFAGHRRLVFTAAHLPWVAAFAQDATRSGRRWIAAALATGLSIWCGHYQVLYIGFVGLALFFMIESVVGWKGVLHRARRAAIGLTTMFLAGAALASIRLLPALDALKASQRSSGGEQFAATHGSAPANLLTFVWPHLFGNHVDTRFIGEWSYWESLGYVGILPLLLVLFAPFVLRGGKWVAGWVLLTLGIVLSLGAATPLFDLYLRMAPGAQLFRSPGRYVLWVSLFAAILAAEALDAISREKSKSPRSIGLSRPVGALLLVALIAVLAFWIAVRSTSITGWQAWLLGFGSQIRSESLTAEVWAALHRLALEDALRAVVVLAGGSVLLLLWRNPKPARKDRDRRAHETRLLQSARGWGVVALVFVDLASFGHRFLVTGPASRFEWPNGVTQFLQAQNDPGLRILDHPDLRSPGRGAAFGIAQVGGYDTFVPADYMRYVRTARGLDPDAIVSWYQTRQTNPAIDRLGARFYLDLGGLHTREAAHRGFAAWREVARFDSVVIYQNPHPEPRAFVTHDVREAAEAEIFRTLADSSFQLADALLLEDAPPPEFRFEPRKSRETAGNATSETSGVPSGLAESTDEARITTYGPDRVVIEVKASSAGALVLSDNWHRDWRCRIDGEEVPVVRANAIMRAVPIDAGVHEAVFEFRPRAFALGLSGSLASLALLGAFAMYQRRRVR